MPTSIQAVGEVLPVSRYNTGTQPSQNLQLTSQGGALIGLGLPLNAEVVRLGNSYVGGTTTAIAPVAAIPTTAAHLSIFNGEPAGGKSYIIQRASFVCVVSAAAAIVQQLLCCQTTVAVTSITGTTGLGPKSLSGRTSNSAATVLSAVTIVNNGVWHPIGPSVNGAAATATIGMGADWDANGLYVIPPGGQFCLAVLCSAAGSCTNQIYCTWHECLVALG